MQEKPTIKHIVISGGGTFGLTVYSLLAELQKKDFWNLKMIESFYGTSVGTIVTLLFLLDYDYETIENYLIKRPWDKLFQYDIEKCISSFDNCGAFDISAFCKAFEPLFKGKDIDLDITLKELYDKTQKEFFIYTTELNSFTCVCLSHHTHPDWKVVDAIYASCCLPIIFRPLIKDDKAYADGGIFLNYPISELIEKGVNEDEILGIYKDFTDDENEKTITDTSTLLDYFAIVLKNVVKFTNNKKENTCKFQICLNNLPTTLETMFDFINLQDHRKELIEEGKQRANQFLDSLGV
jgi:NTE family protein